MALHTNNFASLHFNVALEAGRVIHGHYRKMHPKYGRERGRGRGGGVGEPVELRHC